MSMHPDTAAALAEQRRRELTTQADAYRLARSARNRRHGRPSRLRLPGAAAVVVRFLRRALGTVTAE
jgi:hypothetical protein